MKAAQRVPYGVLLQGVVSLLLKGFNTWYLTFILLVAHEPGLVCLT